MKRQNLDLIDFSLEDLQRRDIKKYSVSLSELNLQSNRLTGDMQKILYAQTDGTILDFSDFMPG